MVVVMLVIMTVAVLVLMLVFVVMVMIVPTVGTVLVIMIVMVMAAARPVDMAFGRVLVVEERLGAHCHIAILVGVKGIHAGQDSKAHGLECCCSLVGFCFSARELHEGIAEFNSNSLGCQKPNDAK